MIRDVEGIVCVRKDTTDNFKTNNPILDDGEVACESDTGQFKIGDGTSKWTDLGYIKPNYLNDEWNTLESNMMLSSGTYLIKVTFADKTSGTSNSTTFTDLISVSKNDSTIGFFGNYDPPSGPLHIYISNKTELQYKTIRIKAKLMANGSFSVDLYISSVTSNGSILFPNTLVNDLTSSEFEYTINYKRLM